MKTLKLFIGASLLVAACFTLAAAAQSFTLAGKITDSSGKPLPGVEITVSYSTAKALSDKDGKYSIPVKQGDNVVFRLSGYAKQEHKVKGRTLDVKMLRENEVPAPAQALKVVDNEVIETQMVFADFCEDAAFNAPPSRTAASREMMKMTASPTYAPDYNGMDAEEYGALRENRFVSVAKDPLSTFALEVDGASYSNMRRMINNGQMPGKDAIRVEEFVNYFSYGYEEPRGSDPLKISYEVAPCPWNKQHKLVRIGVKAKEIPSENLPKTNFVFLIDVSGSMWGGNRLPLVKSSLKLLVNNLRDDDRVAIVAYAGAAGEVLPSTPGSDKQKIREALDALTAGGSTAGGAGIQLAYKIAKQNFITGGNNRIILCTDGDFNVGISSNEGLESLVEKERKSGVFLTVLGYGMGNYKDSKLQTLAEKGNGNHAYIDNLQEANKVLVSEFGGTMYTVAKDVKLQVEFNPAHVQAFRLVGYESRLLEHEDFNDDTKDAGEIGAGHSVTAFYEVVPVGVKGNYGSVDPLKYQSEPAAPQFKHSGKAYPDLMTVKLRYKEPDGEHSKLMEVPVIENRNSKLSEDYYFASAAAMFGQLLRDSDFKGDATYDMVIAQARRGLGNDPHGYRREFIRLVETAKGMAK